MRRTTLVAGALLVLGAASAAHADEVLPLALPPMFHVDDAANVVASITDTKRAISAQYDAAETWLGMLGAGAVIDDAMQTYSLQLHGAAGGRYGILHRKLASGQLRVGIDARIVAEAIWTQPGKDDARDLRVAVDGGVGTWFVTPKRTHVGVHVGWDSAPGARTDGTGGLATELVFAVALGMPYGEPDPHAALHEQQAIEEMLKSDPAKWPEGAYLPSSTRQGDETIITVGLVYARPTDAMFEQRLVFALGVLYP